MPTPPAPSGLTVSPAVMRWLDGIDEYLEPSKRTAAKAAPGKSALAYCIEREPGISQDATRYQFVCRNVRHNSNETFRVDPAGVPAKPIRTTKYLATNDFPLVSHFNELMKHHGRNSYGIRLFGEGWEPLLTGALAADALYFSPTVVSYAGKPDFRRLTDGPPVMAAPAWEIMADGSARPVIHPDREGLIVLSTSPSRYIDPIENIIGLLECGLSAGFLHHWQGGPVVAVQEIGAVAEFLAALPSPKPLPPPRDHDTQIRDDLEMRPRLHIRRIQVGVFRRSVIAGMLSFRYGESPAAWPLDEQSSTRFTWKEGESRIVIERDRSAEQAAMNELYSLGLSPLSAHFVREDLNETNRHAVVTSKNFAAHSTEWIQVIFSNDFRSLAGKGWDIEIDSGLGLEVHDIDKFFPQIETDSKRGIDWFRFDVFGETGGKRISLIPQIATAIRSGWLELQAYEKTVAGGETGAGMLSEFLLISCENAADGHIRFPSDRFISICRQVAHFFHNHTDAGGPLAMDRLGAAGVADALAIDSTETSGALAGLGRRLRDVAELPAVTVPSSVKAKLRPYQIDGCRWLQFLAETQLHGILADDMGLGKTLQTLTHLAIECAKNPGLPSLVVAPTSVVPNWAAEAEKFVPHLKVLTLHGKDRAEDFGGIAGADIVLTSYPLLTRDFEIFVKHKWHALVLDEAQTIKNPRAITSRCVCQLVAAQRICLSGTPMENHLGELWSLMRFLMPGFLGDEKTFNTNFRKPIEKDRSPVAQLALSRRISPLILRRTKDQVATDLPAKTELIHHVDLNPEQTDLYESVRASMDERVRDAIAAKGLAKSHIIVLDALLKLRQICCHPHLLKNSEAARAADSAKLDYLTDELLPTLMDEGRRILLFSSFTSMLALIEAHLVRKKIPYLQLTGQTKERAELVKRFQTGEIPIFLISLKAGGTGLNLTAADTIIHYDPWWNPAAENQATDRAHRIGQTKPVFVHKLVCTGTIEDRILELQKHKSALVEALLTDETSKLKIDADTLSHLLAPLESFESAAGSNSGNVKR